MNHTYMKLKTAVLSEFFATFHALVILDVVVRNSNVLFHILSIFKSLVTLVAAIPGTNSYM